ncbi:MAG: hypothetical protein V4438_02680 [Patescibacteria group bacterium]
MRKQLIFLTLFFSSLLWIANSFAEKYDLYFVTTWFDNISHTLGGIVMAGLFIIFYDRILRRMPLRQSVFFFTFFIGVMWEFFELYKGLTNTGMRGYYIDTAGDIFFDMLGAGFTCLFAYRNNNSKH